LLLLHKSKKVYKLLIVSFQINQLVVVCGQHVKGFNILRANGISVILLSLMKNTCNLIDVLKEVGSFFEKKVIITHQAAKQR